MEVETGLEFEPTSLENCLPAACLLLLSNQIYRLWITQCWMGGGYSGETGLYSGLELNEYCAVHIPDSKQDE